jgi:hypothetical protein
MGLHNIILSSDSTVVKAIIEVVSICFVYGAGVEA